MSSISPALPGKPEPAWDIARLFPPQGHWSEAAYLSFTESMNQLVELVDGRVEVPEMPTKSHQKIAQYGGGHYIARADGPTRSIRVELEPDQY